MFYLEAKIFTESPFRECNPKNFSWDPNKGTKFTPTIASRFNQRQPSLKGFWPWRNVQWSQRNIEEVSGHHSECCLNRWCHCVEVPSSCLWLCVPWNSLYKIFLLISKGSIPIIHVYSTQVSDTMQGTKCDIFPELMPIKHNFSTETLTVTIVWLQKKILTSP